MNTLFGLQDEAAFPVKVDETMTAIGSSPELHFSFKAVVVGLVVVSRQLRFVDTEQLGEFDRKTLKIGAFRASRRRPALDKLLRARNHARFQH